MNGRTTPYDDYGHGTHVAGIIAGNGFDSGGAPFRHRARGAPGGAESARQAGRGRISDVIAALDYVVDHKDDFNIRVVNLSVGAGVYESYNSDLLTLAAKRAVERASSSWRRPATPAGTRRAGTQYGGITRRATRPGS